jgi:hypothetical protein
MATPKLTARTHGAIVDTVRRTGHYADAARSAGVDPGTFRRWRTIGERVHLPPEHADAITTPDAHQKACARLYAAVVAAEGEWATDARDLIHRAGAEPNTVRVTVRRQTVGKDGQVVTLEETREEVRPADWRALGYLLDRHADGGPVILSLAERAAAARGRLAALRGEELDDDVEEA